MSSRNLSADFAAEHYEIDMEAVIERLELDQFVILGASATGHWAIRYAVKRPERVRALILVATPTTMTRESVSFVRDLAAENWEFFLRHTLTQGLSPEDMRRGMELLKETTDYGDYALTARQWSQSSIGDVLPLVRTPTLVLQARQFQLSPVEEVMALAAAIPGAQMVMIDGTSVYGEARSAMQAIEAFLASLPARQPQANSASPPTGLSARELDVLHLIAAGRSNPQIAEELVISLNTVRRHVSNILAKTGAANRTEAAIYARDKGLA
jgi:DNA-binding CsgD family transcriptional regulator